MPTLPKTRKGRATRERILAAATGLVGDRGAQATSLDDVCAAAGVSRSQLYHYFADKADLVTAVIERTSTLVLDAQGPHLQRLDGWPAIEAWFESLVATQVDQHPRCGCPLGSLVAEVEASNEPARRQIAVAFDSWEAPLRAGLQRMRERGALSDDADPARLALATLASIEGGLLLAQARRDPGQLRVALDAALVNLRAART